MHTAVEWTSFRWRWSSRISAVVEFVCCSTEILQQPRERWDSLSYPQSRAGVHHLTLLTPNGQRWACFNNNNSASRRRKAMVTVNLDSVKFISATLAVSVFHPLIMDHSMVRSSQTKPDITDSLSRAGKQT